MKAFICVYHHSNPTAAERRRTREAAAQDSLLQDFLAEYDEENCFLDWGDDPSFFAATRIIGTATAASWGVCRRDVRNQLVPGDFIVWFCAKASRSERQPLRYFFVGCTTVLETVSRLRLWSDRRYAKYRNFYNVLVRRRGKRLEHHETFYGYHADWELRAAAPYILFDSDERLSVVNLKTPLFVAERKATAKYELWRSDDDAQVAELERLLFATFGIDRRLRTGSSQRPHRQIALHRYSRRSSATAALVDLRHQLIAFERRRARLRGQPT